MIQDGLLPILSHIESYQGLNFWVTLDGRVGLSFDVGSVDIESTNDSSIKDAITQLIRSLKPQALMRVSANCEFMGDEMSDISRKKAISDRGRTINKTVISFEHESAINLVTIAKELLERFQLGKKKSRSVSAKCIELLNSFNISCLYNLGLKARCLTPEEIKNLFDHGSCQWSKTSYGVDAGDNVFGILRLWKQGVTPISPEVLASIRDLLPKPFKIVASLKRMSEGKSSLYLKKVVRQEGSGKDNISHVKAAESESALEDTYLRGASLVELEWYLILSRKSEEDLRRDIRTIRLLLQPLGEIMFESFGGCGSLISSLPGRSQHCPILEKDSVSVNFLPLFSWGESLISESIPRRSMAVHRLDGSIHYFDLFNPTYDAFNAIICGKTGKGKSVLTSLLTASLHHDPDVAIIKVDVGGSGSKECKRLEGVEYTLSIKGPSGINPFECLTGGDHSDEICSILSAFLETLLLEEGETRLTRGMRSEIERLIRAYSESRPEFPSIEGFTKFAGSELPRIELIKRWCPRGAFGQAFVPVEAGKTIPRYRYYNFSEIGQAADQDFSQGMMAAVINQVNLEFLRTKDKRICLICDETPFFIQKNGAFFKFTTANVRKYGHACVLIAQRTNDFIVCGNDAGIIENSPTRFLYSIDGDEEEFGRRFHLTRQQVDSIKNLSSKPHDYSDVFLQDKHGCRVLRLALSNEEYWHLTSTKADNLKLNKLIEAVPGLTIKEAIKCIEHL